MVTWLRASGFCLLLVCAGCAMIPRTQTNYQKLVFDLTSRVKCELAVNYRNILKGKDGSNRFSGLKVAFSLEIDTQREWSLGVSPFRYIEPVTDVMNWSISPSIENNARRFVKVTYIIRPEDLLAKWPQSQIKQCDTPISGELYTMYPGNFATAEWFNQIALEADKPDTIGYTVDFTTTVSVSAGALRETRNFSASPTGSFRRILKNSVDFAFSFEGRDKAAPSQTDQLLRQILFTLQQARDNTKR
ncbi:hypothetical protein [Oryzifoliimicrobium ureilyticus]|uniref:hypothetical protein n=1 Tax=Oryzifoliimicrobium ureilyticus TaxID=3113724 RepID=UPI0030767D66